MRLELSEQDIRRKAVQLGVITEGQPLPPEQRSRVAAALMQERLPRAKKGADVPVAASIRIQPGGEIEIDGRPFPWVVQAESIEVTLDPSGIGTVRLTIPTESVEILKTESEPTP
ncbi:hypothetical protein AB0P17_15590 [Streptomyces sp. NPDC088124]|uniref:hypothetical protein n=1 Tax=Streptomyces sp. NPDC088124 TaxID=3154654 RepID=UPI003419868A